MARQGFRALVVAAALTGCGGHRTSPLARHLPPSVATPPSDAALLRLTRTGTAELLHAATLAPDQWVITSGMPVMGRILAVNSDDRTVYGVDTKGTLIAVDLAARRARPVATTARGFVAGPDGVIIGVDSSHHPVRVGSRSMVTYRTAVDRDVTLLHGTGDQLIVVGPHPGFVSVLSPTAEVRRFPAPPGRLAATWSGDLLAFVSDSGVLFLDPSETPTPPRSRSRTRASTTTRFVRIRGTPTTATFSPSGHRLYVMRRKGGLTMIDRFTKEELRQLPLPGQYDRMRVDRTGRWLLLHQVAGDTTRVVDLANWSVRTTRVSPWNEDLPKVVDGRTLLVQNRGDLVAVDLTEGSPTERGALVGGANDLYVLLPWVPRAAPPTDVATATPDRAGTAPPTVTPAAGVATPAPPPAAAPAAAHDAAAPTPAPTKGGTVYLQVSSSQNKDWAEAFARQLKDGGFPAKVIDPKTSDEGYRVVIGPYADRPEADQVGRRLGRSYFVITLGPGDS